MELQSIFTCKQALFFTGVVILVSFKAAEGFETRCSSMNFPIENSCCYSYEYCSLDYSCANQFFRYCNITDPTFVCPVTDLPWYKCRDKKRCYPRQLRCDGDEHCEDGSDEIGCDDEPMKPWQVFDAMKSLTSVLQYRRFRHPPPKSSLYITKILLALSSTDRRLLKPDKDSSTLNETFSELSMQLLTKLTLEEIILTYELSDYINALIVTCMNPRDFFGFNLVAELRKRVNQSNKTNPFSILTLCNARSQIVLEDVKKLQNLFHAHLRTLWTETQSIVIMALACISSHSNLQIEEKIIPEMVKELKNGTVESIRTAALVVQALLATDSYQTEFDVHGAVKLMIDKALSEDVNLQDIYYILPVLNRMSLVDISSDHCSRYNEPKLEEMNNIQDFPQKYILVQFSFYIGEKKSFVKTWKLRVPDTFNLYQILEIVSFLEPKYKVNYIVSNEKPYVVSVGNFSEDVEVGEFWFIYKKTMSSEENLILLSKESPVDVPVKETKELILWYKTADWYPSTGDLN